MDDLQTTMHEHLAPMLDRPSIFFGHSLGAILAFESLRFARSSDTVVTPCHLAVSGHVAPHLPDPNPCIYNMSDNELIDEIDQYGGTPGAILESNDMMDVFLPIIKADLSALESYCYEQKPILGCSISAHYGISDSRVPNKKQMEEWSRHTRGVFRFFSYTGHHFYIEDRKAELIRDILDCVPETENTESNHLR